MTDDPQLVANIARIDQMHARYDEEVAKALRQKRHLWGVMSLYQLTYAEVQAMVDAHKAGELRGTAVPSARPDRLLSVTVGCYICEQPLTSDTYDQPCPGDPA